MSMKLFGTGKRPAALLIAALMIGCGSPESNSSGASGEPGNRAGPEGGSAGAAQGSRGPADVSGDGDSAADPPAVEDGAGSDDRTNPAAGEAAESAAPRTVLFIGTSLTAGLGLPEEQSFPLVVERRIDEAGLPFRVVNAGVSGETSAGARGRVDWLLRQPYDVVVLETGANDMLRGVDPETTERNIQAIIDRIRADDPDARIVLTGMLALPNLGETYGREFEAIYPRLAEQNDLAFVPFLLDGVGGERNLNQSDGVHPTAEGHRVVAETVWEVLEPVLVALEAGH